MLKDGIFVLVDKLECSRVVAVWCNSLGHVIDGDDLSEGSCILLCQIHLHGSDYQFERFDDVGFEFLLILNVDAFGLFLKLLELSFILNVGRSCKLELHTCRSWNLLGIILQFLEGEFLLVNSVAKAGDFLALLFEEVG